MRDRHAPPSPFRSPIRRPRAVGRHRLRGAVAPPTLALAVAAALAVVVAIAGGTPSGDPAADGAPDVISPADGHRADPPAAGAPGAAELVVAVPLDERTPPLQPGDGVVLVVPDPPPGLGAVPSGPGVQVDGRVTGVTEEAAAVVVPAGAVEPLAGPLLEGRVLVGRRGG